MCVACVCLSFPHTQNQAITCEHKQREQRSGSAGERGAEKKRKNRNKTKAVVTAVPMSRYRERKKERERADTWRKLQRQAWQAGYM